MAEQDTRGIFAAMLGIRVVEVVLDGLDIKLRHRWLNLPLLGLAPAWGGVGDGVSPGPKQL